MSFLLALSLMAGLLQPTSNAQDLRIDGPSSWDFGRILCQDGRALRIYYQLYRRGGS